MRVALINMPFAAADRPSLALGLLHAILTQGGIRTVTKSYNLLFSGLIGHEAYRRFADHFPTAVLAGEWVFSQAFFGQRFSDWDAYKRDVLAHPLWGVSDADHNLIKETMAISSTFLRLCEESSDWHDYDVVGFTSTFEQTMACMCLARAIKRRNPSLKIVMGGANFESTMAEGYLHLFPFVDYICHGEGDVALLQLCRHLQAGHSEPPPGIISSQALELRHCELTTDLDSLPYPDFKDYFRAAQNAGIPASCIPIEASRGCWWGEKSHCTFCGLNGRTMKFRQKSFERIAQEATFLEGLYRPCLFQFTDNILSREYLKTIIPFWASGGSLIRTPKFFEIKANVSRDEIQMLMRASVISIQPGIESFSDTTLNVMGKGVAAAQNIALLRWCLELGMDVHYNLIFGFPKENVNEYSSLVTLLKKIPHLKPPDACSPIRMDRFSPNFERWHDQGFTTVKPMPAYKHVFGAPESKLGEIAYFFEYSHPHSDKLLELGMPMMQFVTEWNQLYQEHKTGELEIRRHVDGGTVKIDTRFTRDSSHRLLTEIDLAILKLCDKPIGRQRLLSYMDKLYATSSVQNALERLEQEECVVDCGGRTVTTAVLRDDVRELLPMMPNAFTERNTSSTCQIIQN